MSNDSVLSDGFLRSELFPSRHDLNSVAILDLVSRDFCSILFQHRPLQKLLVDILNLYLMHSPLKSLIKCHSVLLSFYLKMYLIQSSSK